MKLSGVERASARAGELCPEQGLSEFGRCAARLDRLEAEAGSRPGGSTKAQEGGVLGAEARVHGLVPSAAEDWQWLARRLARAIENGWDDAAARPLLKLAG